MKKLLLTSLVVFGAFAMSGCSMVENIMDPEKEYTLDNFKTLLADRKLSEDVPYVKLEAKNVTVSASNEKNETTKTYTYNTTKKEWEGPSETDSIELTVLSDLSMVTTVKGIDSKTKSKYKFYARNNKYRIAYNYSDSDMTLTCDYQYNDKGFMFQADLKLVNKQTIESATQTTTITYQ